MLLWQKQTVSGGKAFSPLFTQHLASSLSAPLFLPPPQPFPSFPVPLPFHFSLPVPQAMPRDIKQLAACLSLFLMCAHTHRHAHQLISDWQPQGYVCTRILSDVCFQIALPLLACTICVYFTFRTYWQWQLARLSCLFDRLREL